jgi:thiamine monophosphate synthase
MPEAAAVAHALHLPGGADVAAWRARFRGPLSVSAHALDEARAALAAGAATAFVSPMFAPRHGRPPLGADTRAPGALRGLLALGGVRPEHAGVLRAADAAGAAVLGGVWEAPDPAAAVRAYLDAWANVRG